MTIKCKVSEYCGGCQYQGIEYEKQLQLKQEAIEKLLSKYGKVNPIIGCKNPLHYRNKVQVTFGLDDNRKVICGNYVPSSHFIVPVDDCLICDEKANEIINSVKRLVIKHHINIFDEHTLRGCLRHILIRSTSQDEYMLVLVTGSPTIRNGDLFIKDILKYNPCITTIVQNINNRHTSMILGDRNINLYGKGYVYDTLYGLEFRISAQSFYQVNKTQTEVLYKTAIKAADLNSDEILMDAYCGTGTIGLACASRCKSVIGVEINRQAIRDAVFNMKNNHIENAVFVSDDAGRYMEKFAKEKSHIDCVIMDPPRTGSDYKFMSSLVKLSPKKVVYVSCGPTTLKDDLRYLTKYYDVKMIQPVDMFPYTEHVETVVSLVRK